MMTIKISQKNKVMQSKLLIVSYYWWYISVDVNFVTIRIVLFEFEFNLQIKLVFCHSYVYLAQLKESLVNWEIQF